MCSRTFKAQRFFFMGAVTAGVSLVSGVVGLNRQSKSAKAQKRAIEAQSKQQALEAQLRLYQLQQSKEMNKVTDAINDSITQFNYEQAESSLNAQQRLNQLSLSNAIFEAGIADTMARASADTRERQIRQQQFAQEQQLRQGEVQGLSALNQQQQQQLNQFAQALQSNRGVQSQLANILDIAASTGGVNEALNVLFPQDQADTSEIEEQRREAQRELIGGITEAGLESAEAVGQERLGFSQIQELQDIDKARRAGDEARLSGQLADLAFESERTALEAQRGIEQVTDPLERQMRDDLLAKQEEALRQGAGLQQEIAQQQVKQVRRPGFFDYANVGLGAANTYRRNV